MTFFVRLVDYDQNIVTTRYRRKDETIINERMNATIAYIESESSCHVPVHAATRQSLLLSTWRVHPNNLFHCFATSNLGSMI